jgi:uncharacterized protein involved in exopolysaccharide biosynthesis
MTVWRLLRILWARRLFVLTPALCAVIGGIVVILTFPPRYEATTRVILDIMKPDPVTGFVLSGGEKMYDAYISSQVNMLRADEVTGRVVEAMGWLENSDIVSMWQAAPDKGDDLKRWVSHRIAPAIGGDMVPETNVMVITYDATSPDLAKLVADNVRTAFIEASIAQTRDSARASATNLSAQAERERERLIELQDIKANLERTSGLMLAENGATDADRQAMQVANSVPKAHKGAGVTFDDSAILKAQLQNIDSSIVAASHTLGPNNPIMMEMHRRRDFVAAQLEGSHPADPVASMTERRLAAIQALARSSAERVSSLSDKALALRLVQDEIQRRRMLFSKVSERAGQQLELSNVSDANLTPIGRTIVNPTPVFPNYALILGGCGVLGLMIGGLLAFIIEAMGRRTRGSEDLRGALDAPLLGVLPSMGSPQTPRTKVRNLRQPKSKRAPAAARGKGKLASA